MSSLIEQARQKLAEKQRLQEESRQAEGELSQTFDRLTGLFYHYRHLIGIDFGSSGLEKLRVDLVDPDEEPIRVEIAYGKYNLSDDKIVLVMVTVQGLENYLDIRKFSGEITGSITDAETSKHLRGVNLKDLQAYNEVIDRVEHNLELVPPVSIH